MSSVLIIDDDAGFRVQVKALLVADGFAVAGEAEDGWSGLEAARFLRPDYVLLDLGLPDVDGFEVADALAGDQEPPIVVLTSGREASDFGPRLTNSRAAGFIRRRSFRDPRFGLWERCEMLRLVLADDSMLLREGIAR